MLDVSQDIYFLHERSGKLSIYMLAISGGNSIGPLVCGFVTETIGWRWQKWMAAIFTGVTFLLVLLAMPETRYERDFSRSLETAEESRVGAYGSKAASQSVAFTDRKSSPSSSTLTTATDLQVSRKSYVQQLSLWPGVSRTTSLIGLSTLR